MKAESDLAPAKHGKPFPSSLSSSRLSVEKASDEGLTLRRSHSCGEMRRRMVLTEWEVVTTTNTEVTITETGPTSPHMSENGTNGNNAKSEPLSETQDKNGLAHDSGWQTLGLVANVVGHRRSKSADARTRKHDDDVFTTDFRELSESGQCSQENNTQSNNSLCKVSGSEPKVLAVAAYKLSRPDVVDRFRNAAEIEQERWAAGADLVLDYSLVDVVENINLRTVGKDQSDSDLNNPEPAEKLLGLSTNITFEQNAVNDGLEMSPEQRRKETESEMCEKVYRTFHCQPATDEVGITKIVGNEDVRDNNDTQQETLIKMTTFCETFQVETSDPDIADQPKNVPRNAEQPKVKEDEDSEEKEADETESRAVECEETEEKCMTELNYGTAEKTGQVCEEPTINTLQKVEHADIPEVLRQRTDVNDDVDESSAQAAMDKDSRQVDVMEPEPEPTSKSLIVHHNTTGQGDQGNGDRRDDSGAEYRISEVDEMLKEATLSMLNGERPNEAEQGPPNISNDRTQSGEGLPKEQTCETGATGTSDFDSEHICVSTMTNKPHNNTKMSPTFSHAGTSIDCLTEDCAVGREVSTAVVGSKSRKNNMVDAESQTVEDLSNGDNPENPSVISESTQSGGAELQTVAQHPFNSCTAVNCLVCATIGKTSATMLQQMVWVHHPESRHAVFLTNSKTGTNPKTTHPTRLNPNPNFYLKP